MRIRGEGVRVAIKLKNQQLAYTFFINRYASLSGRSFSLQGLSKVREREQASFGDEILPPKECRGVEISFPTRRA